MEKAKKKFSNMDLERGNENIESNYEDTKNLIQNIIGNLKNESER